MLSPTFYKTRTFKKVKDKFQNMITDFENKGVKYAIYGTGTHTNNLLEGYKRKIDDLSFFIDKSTVSQTSGYNGRKVVSPDSLSSKNREMIIISSHAFQGEIVRFLLYRQIPSSQIIPLYEEDDYIQIIKDRFHAPEYKKRVLAETSEKFIHKDLQPRKIKRVALIHPTFPIANIRHKKTLPLGLLIVGACLRERFPEIEINFIDGQINNYSVLELLDETEKFSPDMVLTGYWTVQSETAYELSILLRKNGFDGPIIHGGVHPTLKPEEVVNYCDYVVIGEGDEAVVEIIDHINRGEDIANIRGLAYLSDGKLKFAQAREFIEDLDKIPPPAWDLACDMSKYDAPMHVTGGLRLPIMGSRGCPYNCTFCSSPLIWKRKVRWRSPGVIVDEMELAIEKLGIDKFHFWDDNLMMNGKHITQLCNEILSRNLDIIWCGLTRSSHVLKNREILPLMKRSGCVGIEIGVESFTSSAVEATQKGETIKDMEYASELMVEAGIVPLYTHMLFNPGEYISGYINKQRFMDKVNASNTSFISDTILGQLSTPHVKTEFARTAQETGMVFAKKNRDYYHHRVNYIPNSLLEDIPRGKKHSHDPDIISFLGGVIMGGVYDWDK
ncbi:MAG: B12-binding domain-containing radical SAM protein, partial [Gammaproteobacteria bacterium]|nr:B12-binding domain-containing radical SAM protein [Gammaproteobacteria bacterium]